jgi:diguanylate cyclase (GGDEF)-like protein
MSGSDDDGLGSGPADASDRGGSDYVDTTKTNVFGYVPLLAAAPKERKAALIVLSGRASGKSFRLGDDETLIGRTPDSQIRLDDDGVSRKHAKVVRSEGQWVVMDLGSTNGTYHDGERVQVLTLFDGAKIQLGMGTILRFQYQDEHDERFHQQMYESKTRDQLTEAYNKGYFLDAIEREVAFAQRHGQPMALVMLDIDHFKKVNDTYGHLAGDHVLKEVAGLVRARVRQDEVFARYGGEEFALLLPETDLRGAMTVAADVRQLVAGAVFTFESHKIPVTISLGVAQWTSMIRTTEEFIRAADAKLYQAKREGRNRVVA